MARSRACSKPRSAALAAVPAAVPTGLARPGAGRAARRQHPHDPQRHRAAARARLPRRRRARRRRATTGSASARSSRRCCSTTRKPSPSRSACGRRRASRASRRRQRPGAGEARAGAAAPPAPPGRGHPVGDVQGPGEHRHQRRRTPRSTRTCSATIAAADPRSRAAAASTTARRRAPASWSSRTGWSAGQRYWYLVAREPRARRVARRYRVDWMTLRIAERSPLRPGPAAGGGLHGFRPARRSPSTGWKVHARITVFAPAAEVLSRIHAAVGVVESVDDDTASW